MTTSTVERLVASAQNVTVTTDALTVDLSDGRTVSVPLAWFPRLVHGTAKERQHWRLIARGEGVHWPDLDEDISVENLLAGQRSGESLQSFKRWLDQRRVRRSRAAKRPGLNPRSKQTSGAGSSRSPFGRQ
jgi:hypothetical protein